MNREQARFRREGEATTTFTGRTEREERTPGLFDLVFVSAGNQPDFAERAARYDGRFIEKPFDPVEFGVLVKKPADAARARSARLADAANALRAEAQHQVDRARRTEEELLRAFGLDPEGPRDSD